MTWRLPRVPFGQRARPTCFTRRFLAEANRSACRSTTRSHSTKQSDVDNSSHAPQLYSHDQLRNLAISDSQDASEKEEQTVSIAGLVRSVRRQKKVAFAHISDGSTLDPIQAILNPDQAKDITNGAYVELQGQWKASPGKGQAHELQVTEVTQLGETNADDFPVQKKTNTPDFLRTIPHLRFRTPLHSMIARVRSHLTSSVNEFYTSHRHREAIQVHPPLITSSDCEGAGEVFTISPRGTVPLSATAKDTKEEFFFREQKYLTVSTQLHLEAYSAEFGDVWTLSPTFRAEESDTPRHLAEFYMLEAEFRSLRSLSALMDEAQDLIKHMVDTCIFKNKMGEQILSYYKDPKYSSESVDRPSEDDMNKRWLYITHPLKWPRIRYAEAMKFLKSYHESSPNTFHHAPSYESGLQLEHERFLVKTIAQGFPLFVTNYPRHIKPFYMLPSNAASDYTSSQPGHDDDTVACFDLLFPDGTAELVGGSLREHRLQNLIEAMREKGILKSTSSTSSPTSPSPSQPQSQTQPNMIYPHLRQNESLGSMQWYADLRRYGSSPHGGFGMGFDRLLAYLTGVSSIRDTVGFPRWHGRADC